MRIFDFLKRKKKDLEWTEIYKQLSNPGVALYVKKEYYKKKLVQLEASNQFHDLTRTSGKILELSYENFEHKSVITHCDYSH